MDKERFEIQKVRPERLREMMCSSLPRGLFLTKEGRKWVAVDNSTCGIWTEKFSWKRQAVRWLRGEFEVGERAKQWTRIGVVEELIAVALKQGIGLDAEEADTILGYLEGHDYCLMADDQGMTARHDEQYGDNHRDDEPYTVRDAIEFCQEMNEDLLHDSRFQSEGYLTQLRKDEQVLDALMGRIAIFISGE